jgi:uncharacterized protein (TIGR02996 family)
MESPFPIFLLPGWAVMTQEEALYREFLLTLDLNRRRDLENNPSLDYIGIWTNASTQTVNAFYHWLEERNDRRIELIKQLDRLRSISIAETFHNLPLQRRDIDQDRAEELTFLETILDSPGDSVPQLVFADWLQEHNDPRGELIRDWCRVRELSQDTCTEWLEGLPFRVWTYVNQGLFPNRLSQYSEDVYWRFSEPFRRCYQSAHQEANRVNRDVCVLTDNLLFGLLKDETTPTSQILKKHRVWWNGILNERSYLFRLRMVPSGNGRGKLAIGPIVQTVINYAIIEADGFGHEEISPEHLLLGIGRSAPCMATQILKNLGVPFSSICQEIVTSFGEDFLTWFAQRPEVW